MPLPLHQRGVTRGMENVGMEKAEGMFVGWSLHVVIYSRRESLSNQADISVKAEVIVMRVKGDGNQS